MELPFAEDVSYWKSSKSDPNAWLSRTEDLIVKFGGVVKVVARGNMEGRSAYLIEFEHEAEKFKILFPVLPTQRDETRAAERQAATLIYHDVKARLLRAEIFGVKSAFFEFLMLPDGRTVNQLAVPELTKYARMLKE